MRLQKENEMQINELKGYQKNNIITNEKNNIL
jgi:hypothetical protein